MPEKQMTRDQRELEERRFRIRHSAAHLLADAVLEVIPEAKYAIGPPVEDGFYYDFQLPRSLTPEDLKHFEAVMQRRVNADLRFEMAEVTQSEARRLFADQPFKQMILDDLVEGERITTYRHGGFLDLCRGPHVDSTGQVAAVKLTSVAGAYWRGDERNPMLQRIYGTAWESEEALDEHLLRLEEAARRDHRRLGRDLGFFSVAEGVGPGLILWHPRGARVRAIMEDYARAEHLRRGYQLVYSPHIGKSTLWETSGHLNFFRENMYEAIDVDGQQYFAKPMNCPFHIQVFNATRHSYRELPVRLAELGTVYRYERGGVLHGLLRVRGFTQDDAHIFCTSEQVEDEVVGVLDFVFDLLRDFGFIETEVYLSTRPEKAVGSGDRWEHATASLRRALDRKGLDYTVDDGGGAFYGPKVDVKVRDAIGREWQCSTVQFDFNLPERFQLRYIGEDGAEHRPYMVHRALFGSVERFFGVLIEHYGGAFPLWLAPVQATVIPVSDRYTPYAEEVHRQLTEAGLRPEVDARKERMNAKIRHAQLQKVPYMLVVGEREAESGSVSVRLRSGTLLGSLSVSDLVARMQTEVTTKS